MDGVNGHHKTRGPIRIGGCSGSVTDRRLALAEMADSDAVGAIAGDWLSEFNMTTRAGDRINGGEDAFEPTFIEALEPALALLNKSRKRLVCNAGASGTGKLAEKVKQMIQEKGLDLKVAWIEGDEVHEQVASMDPASFKSLTTDATLATWGYEPIYAQAYLGSFGIVAALAAGADIVLCGRVADASPFIGLAAWHFGWNRDNLDALAGAFVAGHIGECSNYVTGGNWSGFKSLRGAWTNIGYPIIELEQDGSFIVAKMPNTDGVVNKQTVTSQLVYEIQGPLYYNSDVVAELSNIELEEVGKDRIRLTGVKGRAPPPTTKVGVTALGGYQAEGSYYMCGLDIKEKAEMLEDQCRTLLDAKSFSVLKFTVTGTAAPNPASQDEATVELRIFAQARKAEALSAEKFLRPITDVIMQSYPGATFGVDTRKAPPKPFFEYFVSTLPQENIQHKAHLPDGSVEDIPVPPVTEDFQRIQTSYDPENAADLESYGPTELVPLGYVVHGRSGDKGSDANVGFYVRHADEWEWLRSLLTISKVKELLGKDYKGERVDRFEIPNVLAVHFLLKNHLDRGVASTSTYDYLGKNVAEYLRAKYVPVPKQFLERGKI